ncbi:MAG: hypothetical protein NZM44_03145, partial [Candidatus Calescibacterium sp.]|nr:hypothetical protein [Candidatus Calescibacterium sp.]
MGGLAGYNSGTISNSYSTGSVSGGYSVGGLVGDNLGTISNSYSTSNVSGGEGVGGLVGGNYYAMISNSFWDKVISGRTNMCGYEEYDDGAYCNDSYGKTTIQMKSFNTFSNAGWNISKTSENINNGYPFLAWQVNNSSFVWLLYEQNGGGGDFNRICKAPSFGYNYLKNKRYIKC